MTTITDLPRAHAMLLIRAADNETLRRLLRSGIDPTGALANVCSRELASRGVA